MQDANIIHICKKRKLFNPIMVLQNWSYRCVTLRFKIIKMTMNINTSSRNKNDTNTIKMFPLSRLVPGLGIFRITKGIAKLTLHFSFNDSSFMQNSGVHVKASNKFLSFISLWFFSVTLNWRTGLWTCFNVTLKSQLPSFFSSSTYSQVHILHFLKVKLAFLEYRGKSFNWLSLKCWHWIPLRSNSCKAPFPHIVWSDLKPLFLRYRCCEYRELFGAFRCSTQSLNAGKSGWRRMEWWSDFCKLSRVCFLNAVTGCSP